MKTKQQTNSAFFNTELQIRGERQLRASWLALALTAGCLVPNSVQACACGCGVFDVSTSSMFPSGKGGMAFLEYDFQDQNHNWSGSSRAPDDNNSDKEIRTHFETLGLQYMFNRNWGFEADLPFAERTFKTDVNFGNGPQNIVTEHWGGLADIRLKGIFTGFSRDLSTGITFGVKVPTGNYTHDPDVVDRDTQIGSGSTDLLLGAFHRGHFTDDHSWVWFTQAQLDLPLLTRDQFRPGLEVDAAAGAYYSGLAIGSLQISPMLQVIGSERTSDTGANASDPVASGYQRVLISPGLEFDFAPVRMVLSTGVPVYQHVIGNQVVAPMLFKCAFTYMF